MVNNFKQRALKLKVLELARRHNLKITPSGREVSASQQIRFAYNGDLTQFFKEIDVFVTESDVSISSKFKTYILSDRTGGTLYYVNNLIDRKNNKIFHTKELLPTMFDLGAASKTVTQCIEAIKAQLHTKYDNGIAMDLGMLLDEVNSADTSMDARTKEITLPKELKYSPADLATISKDFGEILSAIWYANTFQAQTITFPRSATERLVDFYVTKNQIKYPISVKSGVGGKVSITGILERITEMGSAAKAQIINEYSYKVFELIATHATKEGILEVAKYIDAKGIDVLCTVMNVTKQNLTLSAIQKFTNPHTHTRQQLQLLLSPYHKQLGTTLKAATWQKPDPIRFIISPMGEYLVKDLNDDKEMKDSLTRVANKIDIVQVNCNVKKNKIKFTQNFFKTASFKFDWAGYSGGNKLGFLMEIDH